MLNKKGPPSALKLLNKMHKIPNNARKSSIRLTLKKQMVTSMPQPPEQSK
jgi:hypothetical protein